jgi:uncharacterized SAM-binding protein YcdF (DUF218 family)
MLGGTHAFSHRELLHFIVGPTSNRLITALELIRLGKAPNLVLGGSKYKYGGADRPDSELIQIWLKAWRIPAGNVFPLGICRDTRDEAMRVSELVAEHRWRRVLLVTSAGHMHRAEATFRRLGVEVVPVGCDYAGLAWLDGEHRWRLFPTVEGLELLQRWMHEQIGWWIYWWKGWL